MKAAVTGGNKTRDKILDIAEYLLQHQGYNAFSYANISAALDIKNAAVHYHFPTKEDLAVAVLMRGRDRFADFRKGCDTRGLRSYSKIVKFVAIYQTWRSQQEAIDLMSAMGSDYLTLPTMVKEPTQLLYREITVWLEITLQKGVADGTIKLQMPADVTACYIISSLAGALQFARVNGNDVFTTVTSSLLQQLRP